MELEGLGVSLVGRAIWSYKSQRHNRYGSGIPWEFIQATNYASRILISGGGHTHLHIAEAERQWNCVWNPTNARDWSCIATILRNVGANSCLLVFDHVVGIPSTFWTFLDNILREGRTILTRVWIHTDAPPWIPDALFLPPLDIDESSTALSILHALPSRAGHGSWKQNMDWDTIINATREQNMGLVISDVEETEWTLMWHKPEDSRAPMDVRISRAVQWIETGSALLK